MNRTPDRRAPTFRTRPLYVLALALVVTSLASAVPALAGVTLNGARDAGQVGEQLDGYVGIVVESPGKALVALVDDVNRRRRAEYDRIARENGTETAKVAALAARKLIAKAERGHFVQTPDGSWARKT